MPSLRLKNQLKDEYSHKLGNLLRAISSTMYLFPIRNAQELRKRKNLKNKKTISKKHRFSFTRYDAFSVQIHRTDILVV